MFDETKVPDQKAVCPRCRREFVIPPDAPTDDDGNRMIACPRTPPCHWRGTCASDGTLTDAPDLAPRDT